MKSFSMFVGVSGCVLLAAFGCSSSASSGGDGGSGGGTQSSGSEMSNSSSSASSSSSSGSGSSSESSSSSGGMNQGASCKACLTQLTMSMSNPTCMMAQQACFSDLTCFSWADCIDSCMDNNPTKQCFAACDQAASAAANLVQSVYDGCICAAAGCEAQCSFTCP